MRVYVWLPGHEMHGKVMEVADHTLVLMVYKPTLNARLDFDNRYDVAFETEAIPIKRIPVKNGGVLNLALSSSKAYAPAQLEVMAQWPELVPALCDTFDCPNCSQETYCYRVYVKNQVQCMECWGSFTMEYLNALTATDIKQSIDDLRDSMRALHSYRNKAVAEFEGVGELDESLWGQNDGGLL